MKRPTSISEALRLARKRYADGGGTDEIVNLAPPTPLGFLDRIFGKEQPVSYGRATPDQSWPSEADLATSRKYDQTYGNKFAPTVTEGAMIDRPSFAQAQKLYLSKSDTPNLQPVDQEQKDRLETAWLAANKTALGSLGFDPRHIASTPATKEATTVAGFYKPENDKIWYNEKYPSTIIHESLHRGIQELKDAGKLPDWLKSNMEETLVRGMMLKHLGNIEMGRGETGNKQIQYAQNLMEPRMSHGAVWATNHGKSFPNMLTELESLAARHLYEKQPRGPRAVVDELRQLRLLVSVMLMGVARALKKQMEESNTRVILPVQNILKCTMRCRKPERLETFFNACFPTRQLRVRMMHT
jgi:hypothetical protein